MNNQSRTSSTLTSGLLASLVLAACASDPQLATSPDPVPAARAQELVDHSAKAKAVFIGEVIAIEHRMSESDAAGHAVPFHFVTWRVERAIRGVDQGATWTGRFAGGPFGDGRTLWVSEVPEFELGQHALLLADDGDAGACALVGCRDGMLVVSDRAGTKLEPESLEGVITAIDARPHVATHARSVDPHAAFSFAMPVAGSPKRPTVAREPVRSVATPQVEPDRAEIEALTRNQRNPVIR